MEYFETAALEYNGMTAAEKLNYYRNYYHAEGDNTEAGVIANAINEILPEYVKLKESASVVNPANVIAKARAVFGKKYGYIVEADANVKYSECDGELKLIYVEFISDGNYQDRIRVFKESTVLMEEEGPRCFLLTYDSFESFLAMENPKLMKKHY